MSKQKKSSKSGSLEAKQNKANQTQMDLNQPWLSMRSGIIIITILSIGMAVMTAIQAVPAKGWVEGILWAVFFGILIWLVFLGYYLFVTRVLRRRK